MQGNNISQYYLKKLEEFENKYGTTWVKNKYENPPKEDNQYYDFAQKMHAAYVYRQQLNSPTNAVKESKKKSYVNKTNKLKLTKDGISKQLQNALGGFNGGSGKTAGSPDEFYERFLAAKDWNHKVKKVAEEAIEKKDIVLTKIEKFFSNREKKNDTSITAIGVKEKVKKVKIKQKKQAKPIGYKILEPTEELDVYYISSGMPSNKPSATIVVIKNDTILIRETINKKTSNEAEYLMVDPNVKTVNRLTLG